MMTFLNDCGVCGVWCVVRGVCPLLTRLLLRLFRDGACCPWNIFGGLLYSAEKRLGSFASKALPEHAIVTSAKI